MLTQIKNASPALLMLIALLVVSPVWGQADFDTAPATTEQTIDINGGPLNYTATADYITLNNNDGDPVANMFYVAYTVDDGNPARPVTFLFNGGPGSSAIWLHFFAVSPQRVVLSDDDPDQDTPYLAGNPATWLTMTDLVFIDPVGTGFSHTLNGTDADVFYNPNTDAVSVAAFIRRYLVENGRGLSPLFVAGESYGGVRGVLVAEQLTERFDITPDGLIFISPAFDYENLSPFSERALAFTLPSLTATAWYHGQLGEDLQNTDLEELLAEVETWAINEYLVALVKGDSLSPDEFDAVAEQLARYTGLTTDFVRSENLRVPSTTFRSQLLGNQFRALERFDTRLELPQAVDYITVLQIAIGSVWTDYISDELGFETERDYNFVAGEVNGRWDYDSPLFGAFNVVQPLRRVIEANPDMGVFVARGYYDFAVPYYTIQHSLDGLLLDETLEDNIVVRDYAAGHMVYMSGVELAQLTTDIADFFATFVALRGV